MEKCEIVPEDRTIVDTFVGWFGVFGGCYRRLTTSILFFWHLSDSDDLLSARTELTMSPNGTKWERFLRLALLLQTTQPYAKNANFLFSRMLRMLGVASEHLIGLSMPGW